MTCSSGSFRSDSDTLEAAQNAKLDLILKKAEIEADHHMLELGYSDEFCRKWVYYFSYCEAAFATKTLSVHQLVLTR